MATLEGEPSIPNLPKDLSAYRIQALPPSFYYIPNFLTPIEETLILQKIPSNRWTHLTKRRLQAHPSTLTANNTLISSPLPPWLTTFPPIAARFEQLQVFKNTKHGAPNHILINEYKPGEGIMPHEDGSAYSPVVATVSLGGTLVLDLYSKSGEKAKLHQDAEEASKDEDVNEKEDSPTTNLPTHHRILQEPRSLLITTDTAYASLLHGISPIARDEGLGPETVVNWDFLGDKEKILEASGVNERTTRVSLTYRDVLKVSKVGLGILGRR